MYVFFLSLSVICVIALGHGWRASSGWEQLLIKNFLLIWSAIAITKRLKIFSYDINEDCGIQITYNSQLSFRLYTYICTCPCIRQVSKVFIFLGKHKLWLICYVFFYIMFIVWLNDYLHIHIHMYVIQQI